MKLQQCFFRAPLIRFLTTNHVNKKWRQMKSTSNKFKLVTLAKVQVLSTLQSKGWEKSKRDLYHKMRLVIGGWCIEAEWSGVASNLFSELFTLTVCAIFSAAEYLEIETCWYE